MTRDEARDEVCRLFDQAVALAEAHDVQMAAVVRTGDRSFAAYWTDVDNPAMAAAVGCVRGLVNDLGPST